MRARKTAASASKSKSTHGASSSKKNRLSTRKKGPGSKLHLQLKKANESRKELARKLSNLQAEMKTKIRQIESDAFDKARLAFERELSRKEEARKKIVDSAIAKFEKEYAKKQGKKSPAKKTARRSQRKKTSKRRTEASSKKKSTASM